MIGDLQLVLFALMGVIGTVGPVVIGILWCKKKGQKMTAFLIGGVVFAVFVFGLESTVNQFLFSANNPVGYAILTSIPLYAIVGALMAGLFEETGRLFAFKVLLRSERTKQTPITYGLGHGGTEIILLIGLSYISNFANALLINSGGWDKTVQEVAAVAPEQLAQLNSLPGLLNSVTIGTCVLVIIERVWAVFTHIGCSIVVYKAATEPGKMWLYPVAILLHASVDVFAALYQRGVITNLYVFEAIMTVLGLLLFLGAYRFIYIGKAKNE